MHRRFPSIEQFDKLHARETYEGRPERRTLVRRAKIKIHGVNAAVRVHPDGAVVAQGRHADLSPEADLHDFAAWLAPQAEAWAQAARDEVIAFYGEWAGPKIAKGDAVQQTDRRRFYIFAVGIGEDVHFNDETLVVAREMITRPMSIGGLLPSSVDSDDVRILPYEDEPYVFDFSDAASISETLDKLNGRVDGVALCDPYIARAFGIEHRGEGYVLMPDATEEAPVSYEEFSRTTFKAKTERHRVKKQGKPATEKEPLPESAEQFVETFCTPQRVEQAIEEVCEGLADRKMTGKVIAWVQADIQKEAADELAALEADAGIPLSRLKGPIADAARKHFMARIPA